MTEDRALNEVIAIDGPSASGKSTVARLVASRVGYTYVDSGALYRLVTWMAIRKGVDTGDAEALVRLQEGLDVEFRVVAGAVRVYVEGQEPGRELRTEQVNSSVSVVAATPEVRERVVAWLRGMSDLGNLVMEGRDIGTAVFPRARLKFYLDASPEERARRRHAELVNEGGPLSVEDVGQSLKRRDAVDSARRVDPLSIAGDATVIDSTGCSIEDVVASIAMRVLER